MGLIYLALELEKWNIEVRDLFIILRHIRCSICKYICLILSNIKKSNEKKKIGNTVAQLPFQKQKIPRLVFNHTFYLTVDENDNRHQQACVFNNC